MTWAEFAATKPLWWRLLLLCAAAYGAICILLFIVQRKLIYLPSKTRSELPPGFQEWRSETGEIGGFKRTTNSLRCLFFFHGNGGNASAWSHAVAEFPGDVFVLEYPGYGGRPGRPSEHSIKAAALEQFEAEHHRYETVVVCGQSLGAAVTEAIVSKHGERVDLLVLVTPFLSVTEMARDQFGWFPTRWILRDALELYDPWLKFSGRSVVVYAQNDEIVPRRHSEKYIAARDLKRAFIEIEGASHNTLDLNSELWERILNYGIPQP